MGIIADALSALREILEPEIRTLKDKAENIERALEDMKGDLKGLVERVARLETDFSKLEGRYEGAEENIMLKIENKFLRHLAEKAPPEKPLLGRGRRTRRKRP